MPLKKQKGNMYPWVTHMHTHLGGECPHRCAYCYVQTNPFGVSSRYKGRIRLIENELNVNYGSGKVIFIEHMGDLFAHGIKEEWIRKILDHCAEYPQNKYVFQSKDVGRAYSWLHPPLVLNLDYLFGTTIESNLPYKDTLAPPPEDRYRAMLQFKRAEIKTFVTIEPIMDFDLDVLVGWIEDIKPDFVNVGADSKNCGLNEPSPEKIRQLILRLKETTDIKIKSNLKRITGLEVSDE